MKYEWDKAKREQNLADHALDFRDAWRVLEAPVVATGQVVRSGEVRGVTIAEVTVEGETAILLVVSTKRGKATRIISFRRASRIERRALKD
jgi:uncharacterized DUF497 family protein